MFFIEHTRWMPLKFPRILFYRLVLGGCFSVFKFLRICYLNFVLNSAILILKSLILKKNWFYLFQCKPFKKLRKYIYLILKLFLFLKRKIHYYGGSYLPIFFSHFELIHESLPKLTLTQTQKFHTIQFAILQHPIMQYAR